MSLSMTKNIHTQISIRPIEQINLPSHLDGSFGINRQNQSNLQISAHNDIEAIQVWLQTIIDSPQTWRSYRKEAERLLLWAVIQKQKPFSSLQLNDLEAYRLFLANPDTQWCGSRKPHTHPEWKPFEKKLQPASINQALVILGACFTFLVQAGYLANNPLQLMSRKRLRNQIQTSNKVERYLEHDVWNFLWEFIHTKIAKNTQAEKNVHERTLFLFSLLYLQSPRVSEVANHTMGDFTQKRGLWWWRITGKGNKTALIPVKTDMMKALMRYRVHLGLSKIPLENEKTPLICSLTGKTGISSDSIYKIVKTTVQQAAQELEPISPDKAQRLRKASTHWFRHTSLTHQADMGIDLRYLKESARHASIETTQRYLHVEEEQWHNAVNQHKIDE